jgi:hypothetical protein
MKASHAILLFAAVLVTQPVALNVAAILYATVGHCSAAEGDQSPEAYRTRAAVHASQGRFQQAIGEACIRGKSLRWIAAVAELGT